MSGASAVGTPTLPLTTTLYPGNRMGDHAHNERVCRSRRVSFNLFRSVVDIEQVTNLLRLANDYGPALRDGSSDEPAPPR